MCHFLSLLNGSFCIASRKLVSEAEAFASDARHSRPVANGAVSGAPQGVNDVLVACAKAGRHGYSALLTCSYAAARYLQGNGPLTVGEQLQLVVWRSGRSDNAVR